MLSRLSTGIRHALPRQAGRALAGRSVRHLTLARNPGEFATRTSIQMSLKDEAGGAIEALELFRDAGINLFQLKAREANVSVRAPYITLFADFEGHTEDAKIQKVLGLLREKCQFVHVIGSFKVPYFPTTMEELGRIDQQTLDAGADLQDDPENPHPGFHDEAYKARRKELAQYAFDYKFGDPIPRVEYKQIETDTWGAVYEQLMRLFPTHTCREYQYFFPLLVEYAGFAKNNIPQVADISAFLKERTGFQLRPTAGLLSSRDFLAGLAFRVFHSTQYIRHHSKPLYTPEPDICHELMGHVPMFADQAFSDFSQAIGLASLGASDEDVLRLATCYWFTVEFGLLRQDGEERCYGAGLLSSFGEMEYALSKDLIPGQPQVRELRDFDPFETCKQEYPICLYQPVYYVADNFKDAEDKMNNFAASLNKPFRLKYNPYSNSVQVRMLSAQELLEGPNTRGTDAL